MRRASVFLVAVLLGRSAAGETPFAAEVVDYAPSPGQFVNHAAFNDPSRALGPPVAGGIGDGDESSVVTLGGFGGSITLSFDHTVLDEPLNPFGMDAIIFGNSFWVGGDATRHWAECAVIEISLDANGNGLADDAWYLIPGSHVTEPADQFVEQTWDDDVGDPTYPPELASWIPAGRSGSWTSATYLLPGDVFGRNIMVNPSLSVEEVFGYADYSPTLLLGDLTADNIVDDPVLTPEEFYTSPDDPFAVGMSPGAGGGDAFDIGWAVDGATGDPARLPGFDFIRISNGNQTVLPFVGELSPEIDAVADVAPDPFGDFDFDGDIDLLDAAQWQACLAATDPRDADCARLDRNDNGRLEPRDVLAVIERLTGPGEP
jgi:hypothetical protein